MSKALNELKKATMASYLSKAGGRVRSATKISGDFEADHYKAMATANKHHPNVVTPGFEKDPEKLKKAETQMKVTGDLRDTFKRDAYNRIKGIARAGRLLAKEDVLNERNTESHPELWDTHELVNEAPLTPEHKAAIKALKKIPSHYTYRDLDALAKHTDNIARNAEHESSSARYEKNARVQKKNKKRSIEISSRGDNTVTYKNQEGHKLHLRRDGHSVYYKAHLGNKSGPVIDSGSESALRYKHKIGGYNKHFKKAVKEEAEQIDELKMNTAIRALRSMKSTADDYYASREDQKRVTRFRNAIHRKWGAKGAEIADKVKSDSDVRQYRDGGGDVLGQGILRHNATADDVLQRGKRKGKLRPEVQSHKKSQADTNLRAIKAQKKPNLPEEVEQIDELSRSTLAKVATARYNQAQKALKDKDYGGYVVKMKKAIKAADKTNPNVGWSPEDDPKNEEVTISPQEKYRQIREAKVRSARKGK